MENLTISINPPITEWCRACDYSASRSFYSHLAKCPNCGSSQITSMTKLEKVFSVSVSKGSFAITFGGQLCEEQYQYTFYNSPLGKVVRVIADEDYERDCPFETLEDLYLAKDVRSSDLESLKTLYASVYADEEWRPEQEKSIANNRRIELEKELYRLNQEFGFYKEPSHG
ncbi:hypothetical protein [Acinetobacter baumannii]|uniref:hypothetical protein n=1 Tax=Acinetobacter baumannii TaxID=470 RepID=UPI002940150E|nr:hypothetical protein [Acinetobacter baumannii]MDV4325473.1 hypothetical protein [Acinetobacter baumannii]